MVSTVQAIAVCSPLLASNAIFSARRASRGVESFSDNPAYGIMNMDIAAGQVLKGGQAIKGLALATNSDLTHVTSGAGKYIKNLSKTNKFVNGACKVIDFTADNINPIICLTSGIKVLGSDDKLDTAARESLALTAMFSAEAAAKKFLGMPYTEKNAMGKVIHKTRDALYKKSPWLKKMSSKLVKYCESNDILKFFPSALKGTLFVTASIVGSMTGAWIYDKIKEVSMKGKKETKKTA